MNILVPNLGSTSLKYQLLELPSERVLAQGRLERIGQAEGDAADYRQAIAQTLDLPQRVDGVGFKAVHAGPRYCGTFRVDDGLLAALEEFEPAAPVHNGIYLTAMRAFRELRPGLPLVAVLEPGFHSTLPEYAREYGIPREWAERWGVRKYGFHGATHRYVSEQVPRVLGVAAAGLRLVSCHLGGSSSICAIDGGKSVDVSMGFSPQSGLENATRHGGFDAFAVLYLMDRLGYSTTRMRRELTSGGGLAGLSGIAGGDIRDLQEAAKKGHAGAALALDVFTYQIRKAIGAYAAAMGGIDAVAFTGGIGENSAPLRALCCQGLEFLGIRLDVVANVLEKGDRLVSHDMSRVKVVVLRTNEELIVARETAALLAAERAQEERRDYGR
jgi:acetate kinase